MVTLMMMISGTIRHKFQCGWWIAGRDEVTASPRSWRAVCCPTTWLGMEGTWSRLWHTRSSNWCLGCGSCCKRRDARSFHSRRRRTDSNASVGQLHDVLPVLTTWAARQTRAARVMDLVDLCTPISNDSCVCWTYHTSCDRNSIECVAIRSFRFCSCYFPHSFMHQFLWCGTHAPYVYVLI